MSRESRQRRRVFYAIGLIAAVALLALGVYAPHMTRAQDGDDSIPPDVASNMASWALPNKDYANTRYTTDSAINSSNVQTLGPAWTAPITGTSSFGAAATNPLILDGVIYFEDLQSNVYAVNLDDGSLVWKTEYGAPNIGPNGVAVGYDRVYAVVGGDTIVALQKIDGLEVWSSNIRTQNDSEGITIQPVVYDGTVYVSTVPGSSADNFYAGGVGGILYALNDDTGEVIWSFDTVESEDLWGNPDVNSGGGAWYPPAIDQNTKTIYWSVANPAPWPGTEEFPNGSSRPGPNLYTNSLVALSQPSGELQWYTQVLPHDLFDLDLQISPILVSGNIQGENHDIVLTAGKMGVVYAMDRTSGDILWETQVGLHKNDRVEQVPEDYEIEVYPGSLGGVETPMAYAEGLIYVPVVNLSGFYTPSSATSATQHLEDGYGELVAIDLNTGAIVWSARHDTITLGGATVVNDLVFTASMDGMIYAYNRTTGEQVWSYQAPAGINGWPAVTGDTIVWPAGQGGEPVLVALKLGQVEPTEEAPPATEEVQATEQLQATEEAPATEEAAPATEEAAATEVAPAATEEAVPATEEAAATEEAGQAETSGGMDGEQLVQERCTACHSLDRIENASKTRDEWEQTVERMISYGAQLNDEEKDVVVDYLAETYGPDSGGSNSGGSAP